MNPEDFLQLTQQMVENMAGMRDRAVFVGLPAEEVGGAVYRNGMTVLGIGAVHEYGNERTPQRSFLRVPFAKKRDEINDVIAEQFESVTLGRLDTDTGLGRVGAFCTNVSKGAFVSLGYGDWEPITSETAERKGSTGTLIDTSTLRSSISWVIR